MSCVITFNIWQSLYYEQVSLSIGLIPFSKSLKNKSIFNWEYSNDRYWQDCVGLAEGIIDDKHVLYFLF